MNILYIYILCSAEDVYSQFFGDIPDAYIS